MIQQQTMYPTYVDHKGRHIPFVRRQQQGCGCCGTWPPHAAQYMTQRPQTQARGSPIAHVCTHRHTHIHVHTHAHMYACGCSCASTLLLRYLLLRYLYLPLLLFVRMRVQLREYVDIMGVGGGGSSTTARGAAHDTTAEELGAAGAWGRMGEASTQSMARKEKGEPAPGCACPATSTVACGLAGSLPH